MSGQHRQHEGRKGFDIGVSEGLYGRLGDTAAGEVHAKRDSGEADLRCQRISSGIVVSGIPIEARGSNVQDGTVMAAVV